MTWAKASRPNKYANQKCELDGISFASKKEMRRYAELSLLEKARKITDLKVQPKFDLTIDGFKVATYMADFSYHDVELGHFVVEDVKSEATKTPVYRLKKKLMWAIHHIEIKEV